jgi:tetratricopeptide (TPR) repeat protein
MQNILGRLLSTNCGLLFSVGLLTLFASSCSNSMQKSNVNQAFQLRLEGLADSAKTVLEQVISADSTDAIAWFELARTRHHLGLGNPRMLFEEFDEILICINKAVEADPKQLAIVNYKAYLDYFNYYMGLQTGETDAVTDYRQAEESLKALIELSPDNFNAKLSLIELYTMFQPQQDADPAPARKLVAELEAADAVAGAKAREFLLEEGSDYQQYWSEVLEKHPEDPEVLAALGKACLYKDDLQAAKRYFEKAISLDSNKNLLYTDIGRYYLMQIMQGAELSDSLSTLVFGAFESYLQTVPEPVNPLKAFVISKLAMVKFRSGDKVAADSLHKVATSLDANYSKAFGLPSRILFTDQAEIPKVCEYFSRPF